MRWLAPALMAIPTLVWVLAGDLDRRVAWPLAAAGALEMLAIAAGALWWALS